MTKKTKIILAVVLSVLFVAGLTLGLYFGLRDKADDTVFAETGTVDVFDENTLKFTFITPYIENAVFEIENKNGFEVTTDSKVISGEIISIEYRGNNGEELKSGSVVVTADLEEKLIDGNSYHAVIKESAISLKGEDYLNPDITADFKVKMDDNGSLNAEEEKFKDSKAVVLSDVKPKLYKKDGKAYFEITAKADGVTAYNKTESQNYQVFAAYSYKNSEGIFVRFMIDNVQCSIENGSIRIIGETGEENLIPGQDYKLVIKKGFFINDDKSIVNEEYESTFTYVEQ